MSSAAKNVPWAKIVHDKFHGARHLGEAVDKVRRWEHREFRNDGESPLTGLRQLFLYNAENLDEDACFEVLTVQRADLKTGRAWVIKENFRHFWTYSTRGWGAHFFDRWYAWAIRSRLAPVKKVAATLKRHLDGSLNYFDHRVSNATASPGMTEGHGIIRSPRPKGSADPGFWSVMSSGSLPAECSQGKPGWIIRAYVLSLLRSVRNPVGGTSLARG